MEFSQLHFAHPLWLLMGLAIPLVWIVYFFFYQFNHPSYHLEKFVDSHLLPHLLMNGAIQKHSFWKYLLIWTTAWSCLTLALAGPRWSYREIDSFSRDQSLVVLLDLSESMNATDIKPSRLGRAKQKIEDLLNQAKGIKIGLVAFAADPHMITPLTDDIETVRHLLPTLNTDLVFVQGSRLSSALEMASNMLKAEPGLNKAILVISDGGFEDSSAIKTAKQLAEQGLIIHALGLGTLEGAPIKDFEGNVRKKNGQPVISKLEKERFSEISSVGKGYYLGADSSEEVILADMEKRADTQLAAGHKNFLWDEQFYWMLFPAIPIFLWWFRRGSLFVLVLCFPHLSMQASEFFKNTEQIGKEAWEDGQYEKASQVFQDPYRKGISFYRNGQFAEAEGMFKQSSRPEIALDATYNLGNALAQQQKFKEAITAYEEVLKQSPDHLKAKENLELIKKILEQQPPQSSENQDNSDSSEKNQDSKNEQQKNQENSDDSNEGENQSQTENEEKPQEQSPEQEQPAENQEAQPDPKSEKDVDADQWLNKITNDPQAFMKNKFYIESKKSGTKEGIDPW